MSQSSVIAAFLLIGFLVFITAREELPQYMAVIGLDKVMGNVSGTVQPTTQSSTPQITTQGLQPLNPLQGFASGSVLQ
jgi:hypothetical protein